MVAPGCLAVADLGKYFHDSQPGCGFLRVIERCFNDCVQARHQRLFRDEYGCGCVLNHVQNPRFGSNGCSKVRGPGNFPCSLVPSTQLAGFGRGLFQAVLSNSWKESLEGPLPNFTEDFGGLSLLKDCATVHSENVVGSTDAKTLLEEGKFCLRVPTQMHTFIHDPDTVCFCQQLVCDTAVGSTAIPSVTVPWQQRLKGERR